MDFFSWWIEASHEIILCPDKLKLIRLLVQQEIELRELLGLNKLPQEKINKLVALLELKYLLEQKKSTGDPASISESLKKCNEEIVKIRVQQIESFSLLPEEKIENSEESTELQRILKNKSCLNPIIIKLVSE